MRLTLKIIPAVFLFGVTACGPPAGMPTSEQMRTTIAHELPVGSDSRKIEAFFRKHKLGYDYDEFDNRYDSIVRYDKLSGFTIQILLDRNRTMRGEKVEEYTTGP